MRFETDSKVGLLMVVGEATDQIGSNSRRAGLKEGAMTKSECPRAFTSQGPRQAPRQAKERAGLDDNYPAAIEAFDRESMGIAAKE